MSRIRVHNLNVSLDGYAAGDHVSFDHPIGDAGGLFSRFDGRAIHGVHEVHDPITVDHALTSTWGQGIGAEIMGRRKFGPQSGGWPNDGWQGWWGDEPPFRTPVFVMTHYERPPVQFANGTSFHFTSGSPAEVLHLARDAADGGDVRLGGGPTTIRQFLRADLVDFMHLVIVPIVLGHGVALWDEVGDLRERFSVESVSTASGLTHRFFNRTATG